MFIGVLNSLIVAPTNVERTLDVTWVSGIVASRKNSFSIFNTTFVDYYGPDVTALSGCSQCKLFNGGFTISLFGNIFVNSPNKVSINFLFDFLVHYFEFNLHFIFRCFNFVSN